MNKKTTSGAGIGAAALSNAPADSAAASVAIAGGTPLFLRRPQNPAPPSAPAEGADAALAAAAPAPASATAQTPAGESFDAGREAGESAERLRQRNAELEAQIARQGEEAALLAAQGVAVERQAQLRAADFPQEAETLAEVVSQATDAQVILDAVEAASSAALNASAQRLRERSTHNGGALQMPVSPGSGEANDSPISRFGFSEFGRGLAQLQSGAPLDGIFGEIDQESRKGLNNSTMKDLPELSSRRGAWVPLSLISGLTREYTNLEAMLGGVGAAQLAQTYGAVNPGGATGSNQGDVTTENVFRQDMIANFLRPHLYEQFLGIRSITTDNNMTIPFVNTAPSGQDLNEIERMTSEGLTFSVKTTEPHRMGVQVPITLQLLAAGDRHIGIMQLVSSEMERALSQRCEDRLYNGDGGNKQPRGLLHTSGTHTLSFSSSPNHSDLVKAPVQLGEQNIMPMSPRWLMQLHWQPYLKTNLNFPGTLNAVPLWERGNPLAMNGSDGNPMMNPFMGVVEGTPAYASNLLPTDADGDSTDKKHLIFGDFSELLKIMYGMAFITFDDISKTDEGYVVLRINLFYDVLTRRANAFTIGKHAV